jgi:hypothetical protein
VSTTAHNPDRERANQTYWNLLELVGLLLSHRLTKQHERSEKQNLDQVAEFGAITIVGLLRGYSRFCFSDSIDLRRARQ